MWRLSVQPSTDSRLPAVDVQVSADPDGSVADLAASLGSHLGGENSQLLLAPTTDGQPWSATRRLSDTGLRNGDVITVSSVNNEWLTRPTPTLRARAVVHVITGPDAGEQFPVTGDVVTIGRSSDADVRLSDPLVSRTHAQIMLSETPLVRDSGSAHGTTVSGRTATSVTAVDWGEPIHLGDTTIKVLEGSATHRDNSVFRSPRFGKAISQTELDVPAPPGAPQKVQFPWPMMLMPVMMGGAMFAWSRSPMSLIFMIGFPLMMATNYLVQRRQSRKTHQEEVALWRKDVAAVLKTVDQAAATQREHANDDDPDVEELLSRATARHHRLWVRQRTDDDFLTVRAGRGPVAAALTMKAPNSGERSLRDEVNRAITRRATLADMPVPVRLNEFALTAVTGPREDVDGWLRAFILRLAVTHSPHDVRITAVLGSDRSRMESWLRWLPHAEGRLSRGFSVAVGPSEAYELLEDLMTLDGGDGFTLCVVDAHAGLPRRLIEELAALAGEKDSRIRILWVGERIEEVPAATGLVVDLNDAAVQTRNRGGVEKLTLIDNLDLASTWRAARALSGYTDEAATVADESKVPQQVRLPELTTDITQPDDVAAIASRWMASRGLRAQIGAGADGVVTVDLREDGPHGLVAGTTGAGKSELLQSLICSLALNNPPSRINFLLVDYKGGAAFRECAQLPHTVGYITDLSPALVQRALTSMHAELAARERLLDEYGAKDLIALEESHPEVAPPSMLICVDEFAALLAEVPEFIDGMVSIAQRGRSLGMHMLLATQRPAGVVTPQIKANTDLRIALRVASAEDSADVIDAPDAATISRRTPGRAYLRRTGHGTREVVQVAWVGAKEELTENAAKVAVTPFSARALPELKTPNNGSPKFHPETDLERIVTATTTAFLRSGHAAPKRPWIPPMAEVLPIACTAPGHFALGSDAGDEALVAGAGSDVIRAQQDSGTAVLGVVDRPAEQQQVPWVVDYAKSGHLLAFGATGSGKTELLRTLAAVATCATEAAPVCVYGIDAAGGGLGVLERLPSVGSIVSIQQLAQVLRLIRMVHRTVEHRNVALAQRGVSDIDSLAAAGEPMRRIHLLIDNLPALMEALEGGGAHRRQHAEQLLTILQDGRRCGIHVTATSPQRTGLPSQLQACFGQRLVLRMTVDDDYAMLGVPTDIITGDSAPGRGLHGKDEVQIGIIGNGGAAEQAAQLDRIALEMSERFDEGSQVGVPLMPERLPQAIVPEPEHDDVVIGVEEDLVAPTKLDLRDSPLLIAGRARSGRTGLLLGIAQLAKRAQHGPSEIVMIGPRTDAGVEVPGGAVWASECADLVLQTPEQVLTWLQSAPVPEEDQWRLLLVDDLHEWERHWEAAGAEREMLEALTAFVQIPEHRVAVVAATDSDEARSRQHIPGLTSWVRRSRRAVLLGAEMADGTLAGVQVPMSTHEPLTGAGRGLLASGGQTHVVHVISPNLVEEES